MVGEEPVLPASRASRLLIIFVCSITLGYAVQWGMRQATSLTSTPTSAPQSLVRHLAEMASLANQSVPMMMDSETELMNTMAVGTEFAYNLRMVNILPAQASQREVQQLIDEEVKPEGTRGVCSNPDSGNTIRSGATFVYLFHYADKTYAARCGTSTGCPCSDRFG